jgi:hypothetical protein
MGELYLTPNRPSTARIFGARRELKGELPFFLKLKYNPFHPRRLDTARL